MRNFYGVLTDFPVLKPSKIRARGLTIGEYPQKEAQGLNVFFSPQSINTID